MQILVCMDKTSGNTVFLHTYIPIFFFLFLCFFRPFWYHFFRRFFKAFMRRIHPLMDIAAKPTRKTEPATPAKTPLPKTKPKIPFPRFTVHPKYYGKAAPKDNVINPPATPPNFNFAFSAPSSHTSSVSSFVQSQSSVDYNPLPSFTQSRVTFTNNNDNMNQFETPDNTDADTGRRQNTSETPRQKTPNPSQRWMSTPDATQRQLTQNENRRQLTQNENINGNKKKSSDHTLIWKTIIDIKQQLNEISSAQQTTEEPANPLYELFVQKELYEEIDTPNEPVSKEQNREVTSDLKNILFGFSTPQNNVLNWFSEIERIFKRYDLHASHWFKYAERALKDPASRVQQQVALNHANSDNETYKYIQFKQAMFTKFLPSTWLSTLYGKIDRNLPMGTTEEIASVYLNIAPHYVYINDNPITETIFNTFWRKLPKTHTTILLSFMNQNKIKNEQIFLQQILIAYASLVEQLRPIDSTYWRSIYGQNPFQQFGVQLKNMPPESKSPFFSVDSKRERQLILRYNASFIDFTSIQNITVPELHETAQFALNNRLYVSYNMHTPSFHARGRQLNIQHNRQSHTNFHRSKSYNFRPRNSSFFNGNNSQTFNRNNTPAWSSKQNISTPNQAQNIMQDRMLRRNIQQQKHTTPSKPPPPRRNNQNSDTSKQTIFNYGKNSYKKPIASTNAVAQQTPPFRSVSNNEKPTRKVNKHIKFNTPPQTPQYTELLNKIQSIQDTLQNLHLHNSIVVSNQMLVENTTTYSNTVTTNESTDTHTLSLYNLKFKRTTTPIKTHITNPNISLQLLTLFAYINGRVQVKCLIDTGSQIDIISKNIVDAFELQTEQIHEPLTVQFVGGAKSNTYTKLKNTQLTIATIHPQNKHDTTWHTSVFEPHVTTTPLSYDVVLGLPWLTLNVRAINIYDSKLELLHNNLYTSFAALPTRNYINKLLRNDPQQSYNNIGKNVELLHHHAPTSFYYSSVIKQITPIAEETNNNVMVKHPKNNTPTLDKVKHKQQMYISHPMTVTHLIC